MKRTVAALAFLVFTGTAAHSRDLVTIRTAAGIDIKVANDDFARRIKGFTADLVAEGKRPSRIHCYATGGHVQRSRHYSGHACDFNGSANRWPPMNRHRVSHLTAKWGLRDGCDFNDCGHIDDGRTRFKAVDRQRNKSRKSADSGVDMASIPPYPLTDTR